MLIARYRPAPEAAAAVGVIDVDSGHITELAGVGSVAHLLTLRLDELRRTCAVVSGVSIAIDEVELLAPVDGRTEVWAAGVTYSRSRDARVEESAQFAAAYDLVYDAERPELFFKSAAWRVVGPGATVAIREDSEIDVPEAELAVVVNRHGEIVGYTICDDVSSRTIEGANPLYLPQAKTYLGSCAVGPAIRPSWELTDDRDLAITVAIRRGESVVWTGVASTRQLKRDPRELVRYLLRADEFPHGVVLSTGTCLVPELPLSLRPADVVTIDIAGIGTLSNPVVRGKQHVAWLVDELARVGG